MEHRGDIEGLERGEPGGGLAVGKAELPVLDGRLGDVDNEGQQEREQLAGDRRDPVGAANWPCLEELRCPPQGHEQAIGHAGHRRDDRLIIHDECRDELVPSPTQDHTRRKARTPAASRP